MASHFFALFSRMKHMNRWALMRNVTNENLSTHSLEVAAIAHALAVIGNRRLGKHYNADRAALLGVYHDMPEILTGDMPTPVKYHNTEIRRAFGEIELSAQQTILDTLPADMKDDFAPLISPDETEDIYKLVKAADKISALIKCIEEEKAGNTEFAAAKTSIEALIHALNCPAAECFLEEFIGSYRLNLDELQQKMP